MYTFYTKEPQLLTIDNTLYLHMSFISLLTVAILNMFVIEKRQLYNSSNAQCLHAFSTTST